MGNEGRLALRVHTCILGSWRLPLLLCCRLQFALGKQDSIHGSGRTNLTLDRTTTRLDLMYYWLLELFGQIMAGRRCYNAVLRTTTRNLRRFSFTHTTITSSSMLRLHVYQPRFNYVSTTRSFRDQIQLVIARYSAISGPGCDVGEIVKAHFSQIFKTAPG